MFPQFTPYPGPFPHLRPVPLVPPPFLGSCAGSAFTPVRPAGPFWPPLEAPSAAPTPASVAVMAAGVAGIRQPELPRPEEPPEPQEPARSRQETARSREEAARSREEALPRSGEEQEVSSSQIDVVRVDSPGPEAGEQMGHER